MSGFVARPIILNQTLGEKFKKIREGSRYSLREVARRTGIKEFYLECIESGQYGDLPGDIYALEFIKKYARFLSLEEESVIEQFSQEKSVHQFEKDNVSKIHFPSWVRKPKNFFKFLPLRVIAFSAVGVSALVSVFALVGAVENKSVLEIFSPQPYYKTQDSKIILSGNGGEDSRIFINNHIVKTKENGDFREVLNLPIGTNLLKISSVDSNGRETEIYRTIVVKQGFIGQVAGESQARLDNN